MRERERASGGLCTYITVYGADSCSLTTYHSLAMMFNNVHTYCCQSYRHTSLAQRIISAKYRGPDPYTFTSKKKYLSYIISSKIIFFRTLSSEIPSESLTHPLPLTLTHLTTHFPHSTYLMTPSSHISHDHLSYRSFPSPLSLPTAACLSHILSLSPPVNIGFPCLPSLFFSSSLSQQMHGSPGGI